MKALIVVDIQNDFLPGGALAVPDGDAVIPVADEVMRIFDLVVATQDWHPADHTSFASNHPGKHPGDMIDLDGFPQVLWPDHCVQGTFGAEFAHGFDTGKIARVFRKGVDPDVDSYSGFFDNRHLRSTGMGEYLTEIGVTDIYIMGFATDYCVRYTILDAGFFNFKSFVIEDGCRGIELCPGDIQRALEDMQAAGANIIHSIDLLNRELRVEW